MINTARATAGSNAVVFGLGGIGLNVIQGLKQVGANIQFFATTTNLQKIPAALETQQPYVVVANVTVRPVNAFRGFKPAPGQDPELVVQVDAVAWAFPEAARPAAAAAPKPCFSA